MYQGRRRRGEIILDAASNLLKYPTNVIGDQLEARVVCIGGKRICPPRKAEDYKKYAVGATSIEIIKRETLREWLICWRPCLASCWLDGKPPLEETHAELFCINVVASRKVATIFHEYSDFCRPVVRW